MRKALKRWAKPNGAAAETKASSLQDGEMSEAGSGFSSKTPQKRHARSSMEQQNGNVVEQVPKNHKAEMSDSATTTSAREAQGPSERGPTKPRSELPSRESLTE